MSSHHTTRKLRNLPARLERELKTVKRMIEIYCNDHHDDSAPCNSCTRLQEYAEKRLENCPFQQQKPTCGNCIVHCYNPGMKKKIIEVMRYSGPRMMLKHPLLALGHLIDSKRFPAEEMKIKRGQGEEQA